MFASLGRWTVRHKGFVIAFWLAIALFMTAVAPTLSEVGTSNEIDFLPEDAPSLVSQRVLEEKFPETASAGDLLLVFYAPNGLGAEDEAYAQEVDAWLRSAQAPEQVGKVTSIFSNPALKPLLISQDGQVMLMQVDLTSEPYSDGSNLAVDQIRAYIAESRPEGLEVDVTGQAAIGRDLIANILASVDKTTWATIILVIVVLLLIYRSPVAASVPLITIGAAFATTRGILGYLAQAGMNISSMMDAFIVVLVFGVGTDYALFLISRYREEVARRPREEREAADIETVVKIGPVVTASAATVIIGTLGMTVARFEMTKTQGPTMAIAVFVALLASLSLTPALLSALGEHLFWPFHREIRDTRREYRSSFWERVAHLITARPGLTAILVTALMALPYFALPQMVQSFDILGELPQDTEARRGFETLKAHFDEGELMPVTIVLTGDDDLSSPEGLRRIADIDQDLARVEGVDRVRSVVHPTAGEDAALEKNLLAAEQLRALAHGIAEGLAEPDPSFIAEAPLTLTTSLGTLEAYLDELASAFPQVQGTQAYTDAQQALGQLQSGLQQMEEGLRVDRQLTALAAQIETMRTTLDEPEALFQPSAQASESNLTLLQMYLSELAQAYPEIETDAGYIQARQALTTLEESLQTMQRQAQVSVQLGLLAEQLDSFQQALAQPQTTISSPNAVSPEEMMNFLGAYLQALAQAYPEVQTQPAFTDAVGRIQRMQAMFEAATQAQTTAPAPEQFQQMAAALQPEIQTLKDDLTALAQDLADQEAPFVPQALMQSPMMQQQIQALQETLTELQSGLEGLAQRFSGRETRFVSRSLMQAMAEEGNPFADLQSSAGRLVDALEALADELPQDAYFLPRSLEASSGIGKLMETFLSGDRSATQIQVLIAGEPYSDEAMETIRRLEAAAEASATACGLEAYVAGPTVQIFDMREIVNADFPRVMAVVTLGVFLVFTLLLGSLVAPIYLVMTVLLSYGTTMGLATLIFQDLLGHPGVNYAIPIVILTLLVALGADYNIFLTSRIWEEAEKRGEVREAVRHASAYTGGVITSAGIILAGTFAALMVSTLQSLFQIGAAVALGVLLDTFIVRSALVPAIAALVGRWNWWPSKHPIGHGGIFRLWTERLRNK